MKQLPELYRRGLVVPLDDAAVASLRAAVASEDLRVDVLRIRDQAVYDALWRTTFFDDLEFATGAFIADYEEGVVEPHLVAPMIPIAERLAGDPLLDDTVCEFLVEFVRLCRRAAALGMPVFFVL